MKTLQFVNIFAFRGYKKRSGFKLHPPTKARKPSKSYLPIEKHSVEKTEQSLQNVFIYSEKKCYNRINERKRKGIMAFYHRNDFCFRILGVCEEEHMEQTKLSPSNHTRLIVYLRQGALSRIGVGAKEYPLSNVNLVLLPRDTVLYRRGEPERAVVIDLEILGKQPTEAELITTPKIGAVLPLFSKLKMEWEGRRQGYLLRAHHLLYGAMLRLSHYDEPAGKESQFNVVADGVRYFQKSFAERDCTIEEAARLCNVSERYFRKLFTAVYGLPPARFLRELRIKRACELLSEGAHTMAEVAEGAGFEDPKYFCRVFREIMNTTPTAYARLVKEKK